jgi:hypothetical protein
LNIQCECLWQFQSQVELGQELMPVTILLIKSY